MILVDTSVWVDHLARGDERLARALESGRVVTHAFVIGELACGTLRNRDEVLHLMKQLPRAPLAADDEVLALVERRRLMGRGIGWVDAHLLAASLIGQVERVWTRDRRLNEVASELGLAG